MKKIQSHWRILKKPPERTDLYQSVYSLEDGMEVKFVSVIQDDTEAVYDLLERDFKIGPSMPRLVKSFFAEMDGMASLYGIKWRILVGDLVPMPASDFDCDCCGGLQLSTANIPMERFTDPGYPLFPKGVPVLWGCYVNVSSPKLTVTYGTDDRVSGYVGSIWKCGGCPKIHYELAKVHSDWRESAVDSGEVPSSGDFRKSVRKTLSKWERRLGVIRTSFAKGDGNPLDLRPCSGLDELDDALWSGTVLKIRA